MLNYLAPVAQPGTDYVLIARHDTVNADWQDMAKGLQKAIRYLHRSINQSGIKTDCSSWIKMKWLVLNMQQAAAKVLLGVIGGYRLFISPF